MLNPSQLRAFRIPRIVLSLALTLVAVVGLSLVVTGPPSGPVAAATDASCTDGNFPTPIEADVTFSGDLFVTGSVVVRNGATLTLTAGSHVTVCGPYDLNFANGALHAAGTSEDPITIAGETPETRWGRLFFNGNGDPLLPSVLRHVILDGGGGSDPTAAQGTVHIYDAHLTDGAGPVVEDVTVRNSGAYGIYVRVRSEDTTPPLLSGLTVTNSARAPVLIWASAVGGLGEGNTFTGNAEEAIEVRAGTVLGGDIRFSQTWLRQPIPYRMVNEGGLGVNGATTPTLALMPGTTFRMDPDFTITIAKAHLVVEGTLAEPITFEPTFPGQSWRGIVFQGSATVVPEGTLRHVVIDGAGGSDPTAEAAALEIYAPNGTEAYGPILDAVTIRDSGAYGLMVRVPEADETPLRAANLIVTGSARAPLRLWAASVGGLGEGNLLTGNADDAIEVVATGLGGSLDYDATWRAQSVPYRLLNFLNVGHTRSPVLTVGAGATVEMATDAGFWVNRGGLVMEGTPMSPITITRAPETASWNRVYYEANIDPASRLAYVTIEGAGGTNGAIDFRGDSLPLEHVTVRQATNAGLYTRGFVQVTDSRFEQNGEGLRFQYDSAGGVLRRSVIQNNAAGITVLNNSGNACIDAMGNYWGSSTGPEDGTAAHDTCDLSTTNAGHGDTVSRDVRYHPWLAEAPGGGAIDASRISAQDFWVIADGIQTTTVTITARDAAGVPLVGKQIELETTLGTIRQPTNPTDENGVTTAAISSTQTGAAQVTAYNTTDGRPLAALASLTFWQGQGSNAGLVPPGGSPYASPRLVIEGRPFEQGLAMAFRLPMQNTQPVPIEVEVVYSVSRLNIGAQFTPIYTSTTTLEPGESWDAPGFWIPTVTGHHCVRAEVKVTLPDGEVQMMSPQVIVNVGPFQVNLDFIPPDPCSKLDVNKLIPRSAGLSGVRKHVQKALIQAYLVRECIRQELTFGASQMTASLAVAGSAATLRDYENVAPPPTLSMPQLTPGGGVSQAEVDSANAIGDTAAELIALEIAMVTARRRTEQAGQAGDAAALLRQTAAYRDYQRSRGTALQRLATELTTYLALTQGAGVPDEWFAQQDYADYLHELETVGYDADTIAFHQQLGLTLAEIQAQLELEIGALKSDPFYDTSFYEILTELRDAAAGRGTALQRAYGTVGVRAQTQTEVSPLDDLYLGTLTADFLVGNPMDTQQTIDLLVRPVQLPLDWITQLSMESPHLGPGETTTVTLTVHVGHSIVKDSHARIAVEGYIGAELIGGILFEQMVPAEGNRAIYLPLVIRERN